MRVLHLLSPRLQIEYRRMLRQIRSQTFHSLRQIRARFVVAALVLHRSRPVISLHRVFDPFQWRASTHFEWQRLSPTSQHHPLQPVPCLFQRHS
ncbi:Uncharacterised protein [Vibrio cholerae]|nr:Uncharacterised protein [Vibrio cholerae]